MTPYRIALLWRGDRAARQAATPHNNRYHRIFAELAALGIQAEPRRRSPTSGSNACAPLTADNSNMNHEIAWHVELAVRPGQLESFRELTFEMVEFVASEPGVLAYERFVSADGATVHVYERYKSSAAAVAHLRNFASKFAERFSAMVDRRRFAVFGVAEPELRTILDPLGAVYLTPFGRDRA